MYTNSAPTTTVTTAPRMNPFMSAFPRLTQVSLLAQISLQLLVTQKAVPDDHLQDQPVGAARGAYPGACIELPVRRQIQVHAGEDLLLLFRQRIEIPDRPERTVVFEPQRNLLGDVIAHLHVRRKIPAFRCVRAHQ